MKLMTSVLFLIFELNCQTINNANYAALNDVLTAMGCFAASVGTSCNFASLSPSSECSSFGYTGTGPYPVRIVRCCGEVKKATDRSWCATRLAA
jgi:hypothetical protein